MKVIRWISGLLAMFITIPIWYYLIYVLLQAAHVDRLVWFLYWIYLPAGLFLRVLDLIIQQNTDKLGK